MSNLSINTAVPMNTDYRPLEREVPATNKSRDIPLPPSMANTALRDNGAVLKDGGITLNKDADERLLQVFEFAFKAIRNMLTAQGGMPNVTVDANAQAKVVPGPATVVAADTAVTPKVTPEATSPRVIPVYVPGVRPDRAEENRRTPDVNVTVQVINHHFSHHDADFTPHPNPFDDGDFRPVPTPTVDADTRPLLVPRPWVRPRPEIKPIVVPQSSVKSETDAAVPDVPKPPLTPDTLSTPQVLPDKTSPGADLTSPGPADDRLTDSSNNRNRPRPDNYRNVEPGRRTRM